ncbi:MAG: transcription termination/antitermination protein NusG [Pseudomonadaceae bacterium]|nr:transcription termination/antitermination protein NusG [Pseudomonadaceae bacterium]
MAKKSDKNKLKELEKKATEKAAKAAAKKPAAKKKAVKKTKPKVTAKSAKEAGTRLTWNPQPVEGAKWYVVQTASNYEKRVQTLLREAILLQGMQKLVEDVLIPMEPVTEVKKGQKVTGERKFFPGYVLIKCNMTDAVWHLIRHTPHVAALMGADHGRKPLPISAAEAERILNQMTHGAEKPRSLLKFDVGENVRVTDGPFANFTGVVDHVDEDKTRLTVSVSIFGRATPIDLDFNQVEKA